MTVETALLTMAMDRGFTGVGSGYTLPATRMYRFDPYNQPSGSAARSAGGTHGGAKNMLDVVPPSMCRST